jgi:RHS repeat-associated protein
MADANGFITANWYNDPLDRVTQTARAWGQGAESDTAYTYNSPTEVTTQQDQVSRGDGALKSVQQYDGLGRPTVSQQYESGSSAISTTTTYDALGRVATVTNPMRSGDTQYLTTYSYDAFGRTLSVAAPDGSTTSTAYSADTNATDPMGNTVTAKVTDAAGHQRTTGTDALGRLKAVAEDPGGVNYSTTYTYNPMDELLKVTQGSQTRTYAWDTLQRMSSATNPESGTVSYGYDSNSNLTSRKDARNITTTYSYDNLNRLTGATYNDGVTPNVTYTYNTATNGQGLLGSVTSSAATDTVSSYDARGNVTGSSQKIGGANYSFGYKYNLADAPISTTYPSGRVVANTYDQANRVSTAISGSTTYLSGVSYAAFGGFAGHTYGNGLVRTYSYNNLLQPSEMKDTGTGYTLLDNVLNWGSGSNNGNLPGQTVTHNGPNFSGQMQFSPSYGYDALNRLTSAGETGNWSQSFGYDQYGNMWLSGSSGALPAQNLMPNYGGAYNTANNRLTAPAYDAAGNQQSFSTYTLTYDAENRQTKASDSASGETYTYAYDGLGARVSKTAQGVTTSYVHDAFGNLTAEYTTQAPQDQPCTTCYLSWDHLGSTRLVTDSGGIVVARHDFLPFGQELSGGLGGRNDLWGQTDQVTSKFTSQEHDVETGIDFFQARYHANQQGRFLSADPGQAGADPGNPQSWNGYGYVLNSPMVNTDPDGTDPFDPYGDPCDDDPSCGWGWGNPFPPSGFPSAPGYPPPPPPPPQSTGGLNVPNSGVWTAGTNRVAYSWSERSSRSGHRWSWRRGCI